MAFMIAGSFRHSSDCKKLAAKTYISGCFDPETSESEYHYQVLLTRKINDLVFITGF